MSFVLDRKADEASLDDAPMYRPVDPADVASTLTVRDHYWDTPTPIARGRWRFVTGTTGPPRLALDGGFEPGRMRGHLQGARRASRRHRPGRYS